MARKKKLQTSAPDEPSLTISALIDVSFLLLIYFLAVATLDKREADLGLALPANQGDSSVPIDSFDIAIDDRGVISLHNDVLESDPAARRLPALAERLREYKEAAALSGQSTLVVIDADDASKGQRLVDVLNCLAEAGIKEVTMRGFAEG